jgi:radical SAM protein with 4Fe4S-binding SPASM domain
VGAFLEKMLAHTVSNKTDKYIDYSEITHMNLISGCGVARNECMIGPGGAIYPCRALQKEVFRGTMLNGRNIKEVWENDSVLKRLRDADSKRANDCDAGGCDFWYFCAGGCFGKTYDLCGDLRSYASIEECSKLKARTFKKIIHKLYMQEQAKREGNNEK